MDVKLKRRGGDDTSRKKNDLSGFVHDDDDVHSRWTCIRRLPLSFDAKAQSSLVGVARADFDGNLYGTASWSPFAVKQLDEEAFERLSVRYTVSR